MTDRSAKHQASSRCFLVCLLEWLGGTEVRESYQQVILQYSQFNECNQDITCVNCLLNKICKCPVQNRGVNNIFTYDNVISLTNTLYYSGFNYRAVTFGGA